MPLPTFDQLLAQADRRTRPVSVVAAGGADPTVLEALRRATDRGWVQPIVAGREAEIRLVAAESGVELTGFCVLDADDPSRAAVDLVRAGRAGMLMKGQLATPDLMRAVLDPATG